MILLVHTCRIEPRHFLMPSTQSENCEKRAATAILMMMIKDEAQETVLSLPFFPGQ